MCDVIIVSHVGKMIYDVSNDTFHKIKSTYKKITLIK